MGSQTQIRVAVVGAGGRMGQEVCRAVEADAGMALVDRLDVGDDISRLSADAVDVAVDFTSPAVVMDNLQACIEAGVNTVVGTTGFTPERLERVAALLASRPGTGCVIAPNFGIGAVLMMKFAQLAAPWFESVEIVELHHPNKLDAPSGTAVRTAGLIAASRQAAAMAGPPDATAESLPGARGAQVAGLPVHALRLRGLVAHQEVLFGGPGELLTIRQDSFDRVSFMPGVLVAVREVTKRPGLTVGLEELLPL